MFGKIRGRYREGRQKPGSANASTGSYGPIPGKLKAAKARLGEIFSQCSDLILREISCGDSAERRFWWHISTVLSTSGIEPGCDPSGS